MQSTTSSVKIPSTTKLMIVDVLTSHSGILETIHEYTERGDVIPYIQISHKPKFSFNAKILTIFEVKHENYEYICNLVKLLNDDTVTINENIDNDCTNDVFMTLVKSYDNELIEELFNTHYKHLWEQFKYFVKMGF